ncbi:hypothetical protein C8A05DRAFT_33423 [Staphylotrichum tortipilum]|uniref:Azaphilone pigments biosynthesis cluster protein L N-terminal domain-containing protein n=1 Tax=Staphylotrichum tortipilum TaxID=2831512 RepID=A0AAN6MMA1_9PEZI|nr:hypothetical protein C8A05DRAFT_33423 [Staphylotrichum longicolle]
MDAISGGASVLAFITLAIQSAKTISVLLAGIKDAPDSVQCTAETVSMLQWALEQLAQCQQTSGAALPQRIEDQVKTCSHNLATFASTLGKLQTLDTDGRGRRVWKRVKAVFDEKELDKMTRIMAAHSSALSLSLQSTQMSDPELQTKALKDGKLRACINRLRNQADQENRTISADDVDSILDDLKYVLAAANDQYDDGTGSMFKATITQQAFRDGAFSSSIPRLQVNLVLPRDSLVFQLVQKGRVVEFEALLREGKASLRDHDDLGNSLLSVSPNPVFQAQ